MPKNWKLDHDPENKPLGCTGKYGTGGSKRHRRRGEPVCDACKASEAHYGREYRRGQNLSRQTYPCGTYPAAARHMRKGEPVDFACRVARSKYRAEQRKKKSPSKRGARKTHHHQGKGA